MNIGNPIKNDIRMKGHEIIFTTMGNQKSKVINNLWNKINVSLWIHINELVSRYAFISAQNNNIK